VDTVVTEWPQRSDDRDMLLFGRDYRRKPNGRARLAEPETENRLICPAVGCLLALLTLKRGAGGTNSPYPSPP